MPNRLGPAAQTHIQGTSRTVVCRRAPHCRCSCVMQGALPAAAAAGLHTLPPGGEPAGDSQHSQAGRQAGATTLAAAPRRSNNTVCSACATCLGVFASQIHSSAHAGLADGGGVCVGSTQSTIEQLLQLMNTGMHAHKTYLALSRRKVLNRPGLAW